MSIATLSAVSSLPSFAVAAERFAAPPSATQAFLRQQQAELSQARDRLSESQRTLPASQTADADADEDAQAKGVDLTV